MIACRAVLWSQLRRFSAQRSRSVAADIEAQLKVLPAFSLEKYEEFMRKYEASLTEDRVK